MLRFDVYRNGGLVPAVDLSSAYLFGQESVPVRAEINASNGQIICAKRAPGAAGLALLWDASPAGVYVLPTTRLPELKKPFNLNLELARARMMLIARKREDWGLWDYPSAESLGTEFDDVRKIFIAALKANFDRPAEAARLADECLAKGVDLGERTALFHARAFLSRRRKTNNFGLSTLGCVVDLLSHSEGYRARLAEGFDFIRLPAPWKHLEPKERNIQFQPLDAWTDWCAQHRLPIHAGPLVSFDPAHVPDWLYIWEHDYETLRDMVYEYIQQVVTRYAKRVQTWIVVSGVHANNSFNMSFEQIMELTRISCSLVKKLCPQATVVVDLSLPWGEYYARNQRTIPPLMYADMCVQSGVKFDAFGVQIHMGAAEDGLYVRDLMQISDLLDQFTGFGKAVHVTACQAPSDCSPDKWDRWAGQARTEQAGVWRKAWDPELQAEWLEAVYQLALSKPFVEAICRRDLADYEGHYMPHGGLCRGDLSPKPAFERLKRFRVALATRPDSGSSRRRAAAAAAATANPAAAPAGQASAAAPAAKADPTGPQTPANSAPPAAAAPPAPRKPDSGGSPPAPSAGQTGAGRTADDPGPASKPKPRKPAP